MLTESKEKLATDIRSLLDSVRGLGDGWYACLLEAGPGVLFETMDEGAPRAAALRRTLESRAAAILALPQAMAGEGPQEDAFADWEDEDFLLAVVNGRVALVVACPDAEALRAGIDRPLGILVDRLFRWDGRFRMDDQGKGFFVGRPRLDIVVVASSAD